MPTIRYAGVFAIDYQGVRAGKLQVLSALAWACKKGKNDKRKKSRAAK